MSTPSLKTRFDQSLSKNQPAGYDTPNGKTYPSYMTNKVFEGFKEKLMSDMPDVYNQYWNGKGGELKEKNEDGRLRPPKMASYASSSRFALMSFTQTDKDGKMIWIKELAGMAVNDIAFEKELRIKGIRGGIPPQMDVFFRTDRPNFVEVKCHEIFDDHSKIELSCSYEKVPTFLRMCKTDPSQKEIHKNSNGTQFRIYSSEDFGVHTATHHFDLKQCICHLMGITSQTAKEEDKNFYYLFYRNTESEFQETYEELNAEIEAVRRSFQWLFDEYNIHFEVLYNESMGTLRV